MHTSADHSPGPAPHGPWVMFQAWHDLLFAHWRLPVEKIRAVVPAPLEVETFGGDAWIGVVPFRMTRVRLRATPPLPRLSAFPECNVRTYVRFGGVPGVYFFSLDAHSRLAVAGARLALGMPYYLARMSCRPDGGAVEYATVRTHAGAPPARLDARYEPTGPAFQAQPGALDHFLTERRCLFIARRCGRVTRIDIEHAPWPLQPARWAPRVVEMTGQIGLTLPDEAPLLHFSRRVDVRIFAPRRVG